MIRCSFAFASTFLMTACFAHAQQVEIQFDETISTVVVDLTISGTTDSDTSPLVGSIMIDVEDFDLPVQFTLLDLNLLATETIDHNISFGFLGSFMQSSTDVSVNYATPGTPSLPAVVTGTDYTLASLDAVLGGTGDFVATGLVCTLLQGQGLPCMGKVPLAGAESITAQSITGTLSIENGMITVSMNITLSMPFDPMDPGAGSFDVVAFAGGSAPLPVAACAGDCDDSGAVDFNDLVAMLFQFGGNGGGVGCDADDSGSVDFNDLVATLFLFGPCP